MTLFQEKHFALFGNPVGHSLSPPMHRAAYGNMGVPVTYEAYRVETAEEIVPMMKSLGIEGASVTLPLKEAILKYLDDVTENARTIGAVNTIVNRGGRLIGENTDWIGLVRDLVDHVQIRGNTFAVLGAGGMARPPFSVSFMRAETRDLQPHPGEGRSPGPALLTVRSAVGRP